MQAVMTEQEQKVWQEFKMPHIEVGAMVNHYPNGVASQQPTPMMVFKVGQRSVELRDFTNSGYASVRHISDPHLEHYVEMRRDSGAWDYSPDFKKVLEDRQQLQILKTRCDQLVGRLDDAETELTYLKSQAKESENSLRKDNDRKGKVGS